jgi:glycerol-3-phosphate dehydrogenase
MVLETQVMIIGGGATGTGIARDLALRGVSCVLAEKDDIAAGASGANHGLLHSGARYVSNDPTAARECREEGELLKKLAPHCIENTGGLFVAVKGDDEKYIADFPHLCSECGLAVEEMDVRTVRNLEPALGDSTIAGYAVPDATVDPFKLALENLSQARKLGTVLLGGCEVVGFKKNRGRIVATALLNIKTGEEIQVRADQVINAAGAWASAVAAMAGAAIEMSFSKGTLLVTDRRFGSRVINRLRRPSDGDILVPGGTVSLLGTTSVRVDSLAEIRPTFEEVDLIVAEGAAMLPVLQTARYIRAFAGVRPLINPQGGADDRSVSRGFALLDHEQEGLKNFVTISGGKLTTFRLMAEKTADLVCRRLGVCAPCSTRSEPLPATRAGEWTEPGFGPRQWLKRRNGRDPLLCECEMVPASAIDAVIDSLTVSGDRPVLTGVARRSRMGKGQCQGTFCGMRVTAHMYEEGLLNSIEGLQDLREFLQERWRGERPVLWGEQLVQAELKEALYCGLLGLEG